VTSYGRDVSQHRPLSIERNRLLAAWRSSVRPRSLPEWVSVQRDTVPCGTGRLPLAGMASVGGVVHFP
jgi:hypothetical protein